jgi:hypothetical protein
MPFNGTLVTSRIDSVDLADAWYSGQKHVLDASVGDPRTRTAPPQCRADLRSSRERLPKPDGLTVVPSAEAKAWLTSLPVSCLWGVGPKTEARLHHTGLHTIGDVANGDLKLLSSTLCRWLRGPATTESSFTTSPDLMPCGGFV